jgi:polysaccharide pyruvyl transferase WcaK-like protein
MSLPETPTTHGVGTKEFHPIGYLGWHGNGNMGDDAIRDALALALPHLRLIALPLTARALARYLARPRSNQIRRMNLLLGGGTVIGRKNWRLPLIVDLALCGRRPAFMVGAGVEDPSFQGQDSFSKGGELARWIGVLDAFDRVTVRGPRSAQLLAEVGIDAKVVGDPALLLGAPFGFESSGPGAPELVGVNLGFGSDLWSHNQRAVVSTVSGAVRELVRRHNVRLRFLVVNEQDKRWTDACISESDVASNCHETVVALTPERYIRAVRGCSIVLAERLHAGVLAAAVGVPIVMLEYQPKCLDFMESIDQAKWSLRTDSIDASSLLDRLVELFESGTERARLHRAVGALQTALSDEVAHLAELITTS